MDGDVTMTQFYHSGHSGNGSPGQKGDRGDAGPPGTIWRGEWQSDLQYHEHDIVQQDGLTYIAISDNLGQSPAADIGVRASARITLSRGDSFVFTAVSPDTKANGIRVNFQPYSGGESFSYDANQRVLNVCISNGSALTIADILERVTAVNAPITSAYFQGTSPDQLFSGNVEESSAVTLSNGLDAPHWRVLTVPASDAGASATTNTGQLQLTARYVGQYGNGQCVSVMAGDSVAVSCDESTDNITVTVVPGVTTVSDLLVALLSDYVGSSFLTGTLLVPGSTLAELGAWVLSGGLEDARDSNKYLYIRCGEDNVPYGSIMRSYANDGAWAEASLQFSMGPWGYNKWFSIRTQERTAAFNGATITTVEEPGVGDQPTCTYNAGTNTFTIHLDDTAVTPGYKFWSIAWPDSAISIHNMGGWGDYDPAVESAPSTGTFSGGVNPAPMRVYRARSDTDVALSTVVGIDAAMLEHYGGGQSNMLQTGMLMRLQTDGILELPTWEGSCGGLLRDLNVDFTNTGGMVAGKSFYLTDSAGMAASAAGIVSTDGKCWVSIGRALEPYKLLLKISLPLQLNTP